MLHPVIQKPITEPTICRDGTVDYTASNLIDPLVSLDMVREFYDMQAKSLRTILDELYNTISSINASIETFQSAVDRTNESYILLQRTVNAQLDNMKHQIDNANQQTVLQLTSFSDRLDHLEGLIDSTRTLVLESKGNLEQLIRVVQKQMTSIEDEMSEIREEHDSLRELIHSVKNVSDSNKEEIEAIIHSIIPKIEDDLLCTNQTLMGLIAAETERATAAEDTLTNNLNQYRNEATNRADTNAQTINNEILRAQEAEMKLMDLIKTGSGESGDRIDDIEKMVSELDQRMKQQAENLTVETARATTSEDSIRALVNSESARALEAEAGIRTDLTSLQVQVDSDLESSSGELRKLLQDEIEARVSEDESIRSDFNDADLRLHKMIDTKINNLDTALSDLFNTLIANEQKDRMEGDNRIIIYLNNYIDATDKAIADLQKGLSDEVSRSTEIDRVLLERLDAITAIVNAAVAEFAEKYENINQKVCDIEKLLRHLQLKSDRIDETIDMKVNRSIATMIDRVEKLDNRLDSEIHHVRGMERRINQRLNALEGVPELDNDLEFDLDMDVPEEEEPEEQ